MIFPLTFAEWMNEWYKSVKVKNRVYVKYRDILSDTGLNISYHDMQSCYNLTLNYFSNCTHHSFSICILDFSCIKLPLDSWIYHSSPSSPTPLPLHKQFFLLGCSLSLHMADSHSFCEIQLLVIYAYLSHGIYHTIIVCQTLPFLRDYVLLNLNP